MKKMMMSEKASMKKNGAKPMAKKAMVKKAVAKKMSKSC